MTYLQPFLSTPIVSGYHCLIGLTLTATYLSHVKFFYFSKFSSFWEFSYFYQALPLQKLPAISFLTLEAILKAEVPRCLLRSGITSLGYKARNILSTASPSLSPATLAPSVLPTKSGAGSNTMAASSNHMPAHTPLTWSAAKTTIRRKCPKV